MRVRPFVSLLVLCACGDADKADDDDDAGGGTGAAPGEYPGTLIGLWTDAETGALWTCTAAVTTTIDATGALAGAAHCEDNGLEAAFDVSWSGRMDSGETLSGTLQADLGGIPFEAPLAGTLVYGSLSIPFAGVAETDLGTVAYEGSIIGVQAR